MSLIRPSNVCYPDTVGCRRLTIPRIAAAAEDTVTFRTGRKRMMALDKKGAGPVERPARVKPGWVGVHEHRAMSNFSNGGSRPIRSAAVQS
jgi:hypothetical protein